MGIRAFPKEFQVAERIKTAMRRKYAEAVRQSVGESAASFLARSRAFWKEYESVNRHYLPTDPVYSGARAGLTLPLVSDSWTIISPLTGQVRLLEHYIGGEATTSTVTRFAVQYSTGGTTMTNQAGEKFNTRSPLALSSFITTWVGQTTLSGNPKIIHAFNAFGGMDRWVPQPGEELYLVNGEQMSGRALAGVPAVSLYAVWEEL